MLIERIGVVFIVNPNAKFSELKDIKFVVI